MPDNVNTRIALALEPEPGPTLLDPDAPNSRYGLWHRTPFDDKWKPRPFDTDENAFRLAWARLTEPQRYAFKALVYDVACNDGHSGAWMTMANSTLAQRCDWLLAVLEGK